MATEEVPAVDAGTKVTADPDADTGTVKRAKRVRGLIKIVITAIAALVIGILVGAAIVQAGDSSDSPRYHLATTMYWGDPTAAEVDVVWVTSDVSANDFDVKNDTDDLFGLFDRGERLHSETLAFVRADITNRLEAGALTISRIIIEFRDRYGVLLHTMRHEQNLRIKAGEHGTIDIRDWMPTGLLQDVVEIRGRLAYNVN